MVEASRPMDSWSESDKEAALPAFLYCRLAIEGRSVNDAAFREKGKQVSTAMPPMAAFPLSISPRQRRRY